MDGTWRFVSQPLSQFSDTGTGTVNFSNIVRPFTIIGAIGVNGYQTGATIFVDDIRWKR